MENKADCRQTTLELLKWFPQFASREWTLHMIFEREEVVGEPDERKGRRGRRGRTGLQKMRSPRRSWWK
jgi:hypothetical protein